MSWRSKKTNNDKHSNRNNRSQDKRFGPSQMENNPYDFKSFSQSTEITQSSNSDQQGQWTDRSSSVQEPEHRTNQQNKPNKNFDKSNYTINNDNHQDKIKKKFIFGFKRLEDLCTKDPSEIIFVMSNKSNGFMDLFKQNKEPDWIFLLMKVSAKICSTDFTQSKTLLLTELASNTFFEHLRTYILNSPTEKNLNRRKNMNEFFDNCLLVFQSITTLFPKTAVERLKDIVVGANIALSGIQNFSSNYIDISETIIVDMNNLFQKLNDIKLTDELKQEEKQKFENIAQFLSPPENFRELTIYPTVVDFEHGEAFLRPNISKGAFQNVEHYLDVQFRLLREDFIAPLREGIGLYKQIINDKQQNQRRKKINNIRIYQNVEFEVKGEFVQDKYGFSLNFDKNKRLKINWEIAKRFMYGSLLLFSENEFRTFFLGVVLDRKIELLKQGKLIIELLEGATPLYNTSLTMVESEVFFEPYKCSMEVLKRIDNTNFPMEKYIVHASNNIDYPYYIDTLLDPYYSIDDLNKFRILYDGEWPSKEQLSLDQMQYKAFKAALTHEFTVIQGPPGTGKTFIGLKIMKTLIQNLYHKQSLLKPILIVCYTNHALDQFMEGILNFTKKVVRIGGQTKSKVIEEYNLRNITRIFRRSIVTNSALRNTSDQLKDIMSEIKYLKKCSEVVSYNAGILELSLLKNGMPKKFHGFFKTSLDLIEWLFQDYKYFEMDPVIFIKAMNFDLFDTISHSEKLLETSLLNKVEEDEDECLQYEADDPDLQYDHKSIIIYSITLDQIKSKCGELLEELNRLEGLVNEDISFYNKLEEVKFNFIIMEKIHDYFTIMLQLADDYKLPTNNLHKKNLNTLSMKNRWSLYFSWVKTTMDKFGPKIMEYEESYTSIYKQYSELRELENIEIFNQMHVVALTTTGAAKHRVMLEGLESPIVVVEEAAEVLEAHIVSSLTKHCQHLILIGDHKQLRPSNAVYKLAKDFNFDISLFERMVNNEVPCYTLGEQHRMRPEIALLITPSIYTELKNHISVYNRVNVRGITKNLFFLNHNNYEKEIEEISSKSNEHEATFLIMFARHLLLQGYKTDQVTILTTYSGQLFHFRSLRKKYPILQGMRITVVDNYQGEECDIILLSLVRSNEKGNVGFLKTENRICVALSRAKLGLYIMGNMENLYNSCKLWKQIKETLINQDSYGDALTLECAIHSGITTKVSKSDDFNIIMEGGCTMMCKSLLLCGHYCSSICHSYDREHMEIKCREICNRSCELNHPCTKLCFMDCGKCTVSIMKELPCGHLLQLPCFVDPITFPCEEKVLTVLEECGHQITKKCHEQNPKCVFKCFDRLDCGHACERNCHKNDDPDHELFKCLKPCEKCNENCSFNHKCQKLCYQECLTCTVKVTKILPCGHEKKVPCGKNIDDITCYQSCPRLLTCGHKCYYKCFQPCKPCKNLVTKIIPDCGHSITIQCIIKPERKICNQKCERILDCGHKCSSRCGSECTTEGCKEIVLQQKKKLACGHDNVWVFCCDRDKEFRLDSQYLLDKCQEPCLEILNCNDICLGTCGQCKQGRLHIPCNEICNKINPCNHTCKSPCKERCPPCNQKCLYSCIHSKCTNICGKPCETCKERCNWQCRHFACSKRCDEICDRKPCYEPCDLTLNCGHACIGYCGEPCPPLCRICQKDEVTEIVFGYEDEPDARFIYLEDCKHSVESKALEEWMNQNDEEITLKQCPLCKTPILSTQRFMNQVKVILKDLSIIRKRQFGVNNETSFINIKKKDIFKELRSLNNKLNKFFIEFISDINESNKIISLWDTYCKPLLNYNARKYNSTITTNNIESLEFVIDLFKSISKYKERILKIEDDQMRRTIINQFIWLLSVAFKYAQQMSSQQKSDINMEMARNTRIISLYEIMTNKEYKSKVLMQTSYATELKYLVENMEALLISCQKYSLDRDEDIQRYTELINQKMDSIQFITDEERKMIHAAMSTSFHGSSRAQGHWGKCQNGHIYCVTECGGPMQVSTCPECKVQIGGQNHQHVLGVTVATEMDGSTTLMYQ